MGLFNTKCIHCKKPIGMFRAAHQDCRSAFDKGKDDILTSIMDYFKQNKLGRIKKHVDNICSNSFIDEKLKKQLVLEGWEKAAKFTLEDNLLSEQEEKQLVSMLNSFSLNQDQIQDKSTYPLLVQGKILRQVMEGKLPTPESFTNDSMHFNFEKDENVIYAFSESELLEKKKKISYVGGSSGVSVRVAKGVYYRQSAFRGERVETQVNEQTDVGVLCITDKHLYFSGENKAYKIKHSKIIALLPFSNGIGIQKEGASAKTIIFIVGTGWFIYNLMSNIKNLS